jgi:hypothetical protein
MDFKLKTVTATPVEKLWTESKLREVELLKVKTLKPASTQRNLLLRMSE